MSRFCRWDMLCFHTFFLPFDELAQCHAHAPTTSLIQTHTPGLCAQPGHLSAGPVQLSLSLCLMLSTRGRGCLGTLQCSMGGIQFRPQCSQHIRLHGGHAWMRPIYVW